MEALDVTKLSSKGQVVIPQDVREALGLATGTRFVVYGEGDTVILKRVSKPTEEEGKALLSESRALARRTGMKKPDIKKAVDKVRRSR